MKKKGLVLEGGAMRGLFSAGVMDVLMENGITFDGIIGVSAGATFGCNYKSGQIGRTVRYNKKYAGDKRYCSYSNLFKTGDIFAADFCYNQLPKTLDPFDFETFKKNPAEFYVVASDAVTGHPVYKKLETCNDSDLTWMRASASMPLVSRPVKIDGYTLLDGGMTDSIPLKYFESIGYEKNVVILTQPKDFRKEPNKMIGLMKVALHKYPELVKAMKNRHIVYNEETAYAFSQEEKGNAFVICPEEGLGVSRTEKDPEQLQRIYDIGRKIASEKLEEIKKFLNN